MFNGMNGLEILKNWPRYESGEPVPIGGEFMGKDGKTYTAKQIQFIGKCFSLYDFCDRKPQFSGFYGECVKRPAVLAADGEPLEVGQTVWFKTSGIKMRVDKIEYRPESFCPEGFWALELFADGSNRNAAPVSVLTHQRPVLDALGNRIEPAMDVWWVCEGDEHGVHAEKLHVESIGEDGLVTCDPFNGGTWVELEPSDLYVHKPVLDANGVPIKVGDTVWSVNDGTEYEVGGIRDTEDADGDLCKIIECSNDELHIYYVCFPPDQLTHTKPEIDSWERIEEDAGCTATKYNERRGTIFTTKQQVARDLVRRCRALAERERGE